MRETRSRRLHDSRRRIGADRGGPDESDLHRVGRRAGAAVPARHRQGLGDGRIRHAAARDHHAHAARSVSRQGRRPDAGDSAADRPIAAVGHVAHRLRRAIDLRGLRRDSGRRRHAHGGDHRRIRRARARVRAAARAGRDHAHSDHRLRRRHQRRRHRRHRRCSISPTKKTRAPKST